MNVRRAVGTFPAFVTLSFVLFLAGCGSNDADTDTAPPEESASAMEDAATAASPGQQILETTYLMLNATF